MLRTTKLHRSAGFSEAAERAYYEHSKPDPAVVPYAHLDRYIAGSFGLGYFANKSVLDLGCGEGVYSAWIADRGRASDVTGMDLTGHRIRWDYQARLTNLTLREANVLDPACELPCGEVDIVFMNLVLHHLRFALDQALQRCFDALKVGGEFAAIEPNFYNPMALAVHYFVHDTSANEGFLTPQQVRSALRRVGFRCVDYGYFWRDRAWAKHALVGSTVWIRAIK